MGLVSKFPRDGQKREFIRRFSEAAHEHADDAPKDLVGEIFVQEEQVVEAVFGDGEQPATLVNAGVGRAWGLVEQRHFAKNLAGTENRQRLLLYFAEPKVEDRAS